MLKRLFHITLLLLATVAAHADVELAGYEYWIDSDYSTRIVSTSSQPTISFDIDLSSQEQGIHILNFRARNSEGTWGSLKRMLYFIPESSSPDITLKGYEYWMDNDVNSRIHSESSNTEQVFSIDISQMTQGIHFFNFRAYNTEGDMGALKRFLCYFPENANPDATVSRYEYWIDEDQSQKVVQDATGGDFVAAVDISTLTAGIHYYNFRAQNSEGTWGALKRMLFFIPENVNPDATVSRYEYWIDEDQSQKVVQDATGGDFVAAVDISTLTAGIHYYNFRAQNSEGTWGALKRMLFYIPENANPDATITQYEYWLDEDYANKVSLPNSGGNFSQAIDISQMEQGIHFLNFRAKNSDGIWGGLKRMLFFIPEATGTTATLAGYEYWIDDNTEGAVHSTSSETDQSFSLDISSIEPGVHYLSYRAKNTEGTWGALKRLVFYLSDGTESTGTPLVAYLYRFNSTTTEVPIAPCQSYAMENQVFDIPDAEEFLKLDPTDSNCHFTFPNGTMNGVNMTQTSNVSFSIQFKNERDVLSSPVNADFQLSNSVTHDVYTLMKQGSLTFQKVSGGDFYAFKFEAENLTTQPLYLKADQACTIVFFDATGNMLYRPYTSTELLGTTSLQSLGKNGTLYGIVYDMVKDANNTADNITIRLMTTNNIVPTPTMAYEDGVITITCLQEGAKLYYTIDGTEPTTESTLYTAPIPVNCNMTVKAIGTFEGMQPSDVAKLVINSFKVEAPVIQFANLQVYITCNTPESTIYYTLDGSDPEGSSGILYTAPIPVTNNCTVKAIAKRTDFNNSDVTIFELDVDNVKVVTPVITVEGNVLTVSSLTNDVQFYYTTDGSEPTTASQLYTGNITVEHNCIVKVKGFKAGYLASDVVTLVVDWFYAELPVMSINDDETLLTITCSTPDAVIYYEIGGADPTEMSTMYTAPIELTDNRIVKAIAVAPNFNNSEIAVFKPGSHSCIAATINSDGVNAFLATSTVGAKIYYTTDGTSPTQKSAYLVESGSIALSQTTWTVKSIVMKENMNNSVETTYSVPAYYDRSAQKLYTHQAGNAAEGFKWNNGENPDTKMSVSGIFNASDVEFFRTKMPNMAYLDLSGASISEKALADNAFAGMKRLVTIDLPADVITVGNGILTQCDHLAAITWNLNANVPAPSDLIGGITGHENMLLYVKTVSQAPASYRNVIQIQSAIAETIVLSDDGGDFYCPRAFTARKVSYTHTYTQHTEKGICRGWESIALPFTVQSYTHGVNGKCAPIMMHQADAKPFWLRELTSSGFVSVDGIMANTPYIISMPNNDNYADAYILSGDMTFSAENALVATSESTEVRTKDGFAMYVNYNQPKFSADQIFALNVGEEYQGHLEGSVFVRELRAIHPFECYVSSDVTLNGQVRYFKIFDDDEATDIVDIPIKQAVAGIYVKNGKLYVTTDKNTTIKVYNTNGQLVKVENVAVGTTCIEGLAGGVYLVNGKKFAIK